MTSLSDTGTVRLVKTANELVDSRGLFGHPEALRRLIAEDGYVFMRGLLDASLVLDVQRRGLTALQRAGWTEPGGDPLDAPPRRPVRAVRMRDAFADRGYRRILSDPRFNMIPFVTPLAELMDQILGPNGFSYPLRLPRIVYPVAMVPRQPGNYVHKDYRAVQDMFTSWIPLGPVPATRGGLAVRPGSQHRTTVRARPLNRLERGWASTDYEPGDVLVFHCMTTHAALANREDRMRFSAEYRWQLATQPAPRRLVIGPHGREIGSAMFSGQPWWRPVAHRLTLFDDGGESRSAVLPAAGSRFVGGRD